jgi:hypothetical protein
MFWLLYFIVGIRVAAGQWQKHQQLEQRIDVANENDLKWNRRAMFKNIFVPDDFSATTEVKQLGSGQGSSRQGLKKGMSVDSKKDEGMGQNRGMGSMGVAGMGKMDGMGSMAKTGNRTMNMMAMSTFLLAYFHTRVLSKFLITTFITW